MTPAEKKLLHVYKSKFDRLTGQVEALIEAVHRDAKKIEEIEAKQLKLDGFRSWMS